MKYSKIHRAVCSSFIKKEVLNDSILSQLSSDDSELLFKDIRKHKLTSIYFNVLEASETLNNAAIFKKLKNRAETVEFRNVNLIKEAAHIKTEFTQKGILIRDFKGAKFTQQFYGDFKLRKSIDIDFAIRPKDLKAVAGIMDRMNYRPAKSGSNIANAIARAEYLDFPFVRDNSKGAKFLCEFHIAPAHKALYVPLDFEELLYNKKQDFSIIEHALLVIIHHGAIDLWGKLMHLVDLNQIITVLSREQIVQLQSLCDKYRIRKFFDLGLALIEASFEQPIPLDSKYNFKLKAINNLQTHIEESELIGNWSKNTIKLKYHLKMRDSFSDKINSIVALGRYWVFRKAGL